MSLMILNCQTSIDWVDIITSAAAIMALVFTGWQIYLSIKESKANRKHQELSVIPMVNLLVDASLKKKSIEINLKNSGVGPAIISLMEFHYEEERLTGNNIKKLISKDFKNKLSNGDYFIYIFDDNKLQALKDGDSWLLLRIKLGSGSTEEDISELIHKIKLVVRYKSIYNQEFTTSFPSSQI